MSTKNNVNVKQVDIIDAETGEEVEVSDGKTWKDHLKALPKDKLLQVIVVNGASGAITGAVGGMFGPVGVALAGFSWMMGHTAGATTVALGVKALIDEQADKK